MNDGHAQALIDDEILQGIFDDMEFEAIETGINAKTDDDRRTSMRDVQLIRDFRERLAAKAKGPIQTRTPTVA